MNTTITKDQILQAVKELPIDERIKISQAIIKTYNRPDPEIEKAWRSEIAQRIKKVESGQAKLIPGDQVITEITERLAR
jgi:putative addiction module component (TIGR02574 family)